MGWNAGYTIFEATIIGAYNLGKLDKDLLQVLMEPYRGADIDSGGSKDLKSKDGKSVEHIVIETWGMAPPYRPADGYESNEDAWEDYHNAIYTKMREITDHLGWC